MIEGKTVKESETALEEVVSTIDKAKFKIPITEKILKDNGWSESHRSMGNGVDGFSPEDLPMVYDEESGEWIEQSEDFLGCFVWYWVAKDAWCFKYEFGTHVYNIESIAELEIILAREGFVFSFDV